MDNEEKLSPMTHSVHCRQGKLVATPQQFIVVEMNKLKIEYELISASSLRTHSILEFFPLDVRSRIRQSITVSTARLWNKNHFVVM